MNDKSLISREERIRIAFESVLKQPLEPGTLIQVSNLEEMFLAKRDTQHFNWLVSGLRHALYNVGIYLSGEGAERNQAYEILHPRDHQWVAKVAMAKAERSFDAMETLLSNTKLSSLSKLERERHAATLREVAMKNKILRRAIQTDETTEPLIRVKPSAAKHTAADPSLTEQTKAQIFSKPSLGSAQHSPAEHSKA
jgi:hypothetical protein